MTYKAILTVFMAMRIKVYETKGQRGKGADLQGANRFNPLCFLQKADKLILRLL